MAGMITASAIVISSSNGIAQVESSLESGCGSCKSRSSCGVSGLGKYFSSHRKTIAVPCDTSVHAGNELQLTMREGDLLKAGLLAYLLPTVLALIVAGIAASSGWGDVGAVLGAGVGFALGFLLAHLSRWVPRMYVQHKIENFSKGETP